MPDSAPVPPLAGGAVPGGDTRAFAAAQVRSRLAESAGRGPEIGLGLPGLGDPFATAEFIVVDLETTGLGAGDAITEIGAVRVAGGRIVDEFQEMVDPGRPIPPRITALTGITQSMVEGADPIGAVLPRFLAWSGLSSGAAPVLVAHNASFDTGFLRRAARAELLDWPHPRVVDTLALARLALPRPLVRDHRLGTLASRFGVEPTDAHRALADARTTWGVLAGLLELMADAGLASLDDLERLAEPVPRRRRSKAALAEGIPSLPGVYRFFDAAGAPLYVGSATNLSSRVRSYFTAAEKRRSIQRMVDLATSIRTTPTATVLEARVLELREIHDLRPLFNSASTHQDSQHWLLVRGSGVECAPLVAADDADRALGPFGTRAHAMAARDAVLRAFADPATPLTRAGLAPGSEAEAVEALRGATRIVADRLRDLMAGASDLQRFEDAALLRRELSAYLAGLDRRRRIVPLALARKAVWAIHRKGGGWEVHAASWGRHAGTVVTPPRTLPTPWIDALIAEEPLPRPDVLLGTTRWSETGILAQSLEWPDARLIHWDGELPRAESPFSPLADSRLLSLISEAEALDPRRTR